MLGWALEISAPGEHADLGIRMTLRRTLCTLKPAARASWVLPCLSEHFPVKLEKESVPARKGLNPE
jgi:hypothetical protein